MRQIVTFVGLWTVAASLSACAGEERLVETFTDSLDADGLDRLVVTVETGDLTVEGDPDATEVEASVDLTSTRTGQDKDADAVDAVRLELVQRSDGAAVLTVRLDPGIRGYETDVTAVVPEAFAVEAARSTSEEGQATAIEGVASVGVVDGAGVLDVSTIAGGGSIDDGDGDLTASGFGDDLTVIDGDGDATIEDVDGDLTVDDGDGDLFIRDVTGAVTITDGRGDIEVSNVGSLDIEEDSEGSVSVD